MLIRPVVMLLLLSPAFPLTAAQPPAELPDTTERPHVVAIIEQFHIVEKVERERQTGALVIHLRGRGDKEKASTRLTFDAETGKVVKINGNAAGFSNEDFKLFVPLKELRIFNEHHNFPVRPGDVCDGAGIIHLTDNLKLEEITMPGSGFSNDALAGLAKLPQVKRLGIWHVNVDDEGFAHLRGHRGLESVRIAPMWRPRITDRTIEHLSHCPKLKSISLSEGYITWENGLRHLVNLKGTFEELNLEHSLVAPEDLQRFREAMPEVTVNHAGLPTVGAMIRDNFKGAARLLPQWVPQELIDRYLAAAPAKVDIQLTSRLQQAAIRVAEAMKTGKVEVHGYRRSLAREALLRWGRDGEREEWTEWVFADANDDGLRPGSQANFRRDPFNCLVWWLYQDSGDENWLPGFIAQTEEYRRNVSRSIEGAIEHPRGAARGGGQAMLIDALQDYSSRMAMLGQVTSDRSAFGEAAAQFRIYRQVVRDPDSGLWCQGRGWREGPDELSPGKWSRGHGWLIRGMVDTLLLMPAQCEEAEEVRGYLQELADALLKAQQTSGMWHCLLNRPAEQSPVEVSGTALIAGNLAIALHHGFLEGERYERAARQAFVALPHFIDRHGLVHSVSPGPGPLSQEEPWMVDSFEPGDEHGPFAVLFAALGEELLERRNHAVRNRKF